LPSLWNIATIDRRRVLLAPPQAALPDTLRRVICDTERHHRLVHEMQAVRGAIYREGGFLTDQQLSADGLHQAPEDARSWHLLMTDDQGTSVRAPGPWSMTRTRRFRTCAYSTRDQRPSIANASKTLPARPTMPL
jgi:hypothetical protein